MCTATIATSVASGAATGAALALPTGGLSVLAGAAIGGTAGLALGAGTEGKGPLSGLKVSTPKPPPIAKPKDLAGPERRRRARELARTAAGRPGRGRASTIFSQPTGAGPAALKTRTGQ